MFIDVQNYGYLTVDQKCMSGNKKDMLGRSASITIEKVIILEYSKHQTHRINCNLISLGL